MVRAVAIVTATAAATGTMETADTGTKNRKKKKETDRAVDASRITTTVGQVTGEATGTWEIATVTAPYPFSRQNTRMRAGLDGTAYKVDVAIHRKVAEAMLIMSHSLYDHKAAFYVADTDGDYVLDELYMVRPGQSPWPEGAFAVSVPHLYFSPTDVFDTHIESYDYDGSVGEQLLELYVYDEALRNALDQLPEVYFLPFHNFTVYAGPLVFAGNIWYGDGLLYGWGDGDGDGDGSMGDNVGDGAGTGTCPSIGSGLLFGTYDGNGAGCETAWFAQGLEHEKHQAVCDRR